ncbi:hypothetical protein Tco_0712982 [Tanacetum coccineum]
MEVLTLIIKRRIYVSDTFRYHNLCEDLQIVNVCFANDLFIFSMGEVDSARLIMEPLEEFQKSPGLVSSILKSTVYFCNVRYHVKVAILNIMSFPVKYLGVPLISTRLLNRDYKILVERVTNMTGDWKNKSLSFAGRLQLCAWEALRPRGTEVNWYRIVWFNHCIPRHAFHLWLVMHNSLKTQDQVRQWDVGLNTNLNLLSCAFCDSQPDSHAHLFFECSFPTQIWMYIRHLAGMEMVSSSFHDIVSYLLPIAHRRTTKSIIGRLLIAAASYFIWVERNNRIFKNTRRSPEEIRDSIMVTVRLKILTFWFKNTNMVNELLTH